MAEYLEKAGVKVRRLNPTTTPQINMPLLKEWIVGPAFEIMEVIDGSKINEQAIVKVPAIIIGTQDISNPIALRGKTLSLAINNTPPQSTKFPNNLTSSKYMLAWLNMRFSGVKFSLIDNKYICIITTAKGDSASIEVKDGDANDAMGLASGTKAYGSSGYKNLFLTIPFNALPSSKTTIDKLDFSNLSSEIHMYYKSSGLIREFKKDSAILCTSKRQEYTYVLSDKTETSLGFAYLNLSSETRLKPADYIKRPLVSIDDKNLDTTTDLLVSPGDIATTTLSFSKPAFTYVLFGSGSNGSSALVKIQTSSKMPGYYGNNIQYILSVGNQSSITITGSGSTSNPWNIQQVVTTGTTVASAIANLANSEVEFPGSATLLNRSTNITIKEALVFVIYGLESYSITQNMTPVRLSNGNAAEIIVKANKTSGRFGQMGNYLTFGTTGIDGEPQYEGIGTGQNINNLRNLTFKYTKPKTASSEWFGGNVNLRIQASISGEYNFKVKYNLTVNATLDSVLTNIVYSDNKIISVIITQTTVEGKTCGEICQMLNNNLGITLGLIDASTTTPAEVWPNNLQNQIIGQDGDIVVTPADATSVGNMISMINTNTMIKDVVVAASSLYNADCPVHYYENTQLLGGWDPHRFVDDNDVLFKHGTIRGGTDISFVEGLGGKSLIMRINGKEAQTIIFSNDDITASAICSRINGPNNSRFGAEVASVVNNCLQLTSKNVTALEPHPRFGVDSSIEILGGSAIYPLFANGPADTVETVNANATIEGNVLIHEGKTWSTTKVGYRLTLNINTTNEENLEIIKIEPGKLYLKTQPVTQGLISSYKIFRSWDKDWIGVAYGYSMNVLEGDTIYNNGTKIGSVIGIEDLTVGTQIFPKAVLKINTEVPIGKTYNDWYIESNNINIETTINKPLPQMYVDELNKTLYIKPYCNRISTGDIASGNVTVYVQYRALRMDLADGIIIGSDKDLEALQPLDTRNPLGLAALQAIRSSNGLAICALGIAPIVDELGNIVEPAITPDMPDGTLAAYRQAQKVITNNDFYAIVPLTNNSDVIKDFAKYVETMSDEKHKKVSLLIACPKLPDREASLTVGSGKGTLFTDSHEVIVIDRNTLDVVAALAEIGITDDQLLDPEVFYSKEIYIDITSDNKHYLIKQVIGQQITVHTDNSWWETHEGNTDKFYAITPIQSMEVDGENISIIMRGKPISNTEKQAEAMAAYASSFNSYRVRIVGPDEVELPVNGISSKVNGYYMASIIGALVCSIHPRFPLTGVTIPHCTNVYLPKGMGDYEMGIAAAGGWNLAYFNGSSVKLRDFVTTKTDVIEDFEHSLVIPDDVATKLFQIELEPYVGPLAIDKTYLNRVALICDTLAKKLVDEEIYKSAKIKEIKQDEDNPRQIIIYLERSRYYPARSVLVILV